jgi:hypothetical protein
MSSAHMMCRASSIRTFICDLRQTSASQNTTSPIYAFALALSTSSAIRMIVMGPTVSRTQRASDSSMASLSSAFGQELMLLLQLRRRCLQAIVMTSLMRFSPTGTGESCLLVVSLYHYLFSGSFELKLYDNSSQSPSRIHFGSSCS